MMTRTTAALALAFTSMLTTACAGFEAGDDLGFDDVDGAGGRGGNADGAAGEGEGAHDGHHHDHDGHGCPGGHDDLRPIDDAGGENGSCEPHATDLIAGQHFDTGSVTIANTQDSVELSVVTDEPYLIVEAHAYLGVDPVPLTNGGAAAPGQFPYTVSFVEPADAWQLSIPLSELEVGCGDELQVAVHATVVSFVDGVEVFEETAWAFGTDEFSTSWGWTFSFGICCEPTRVPQDDSCTLTQGFWKTHNANAEVPALAQPWPIAEVRLGSTSSTASPRATRG